MRGTEPSLFGNPLQEPLKTLFSMETGGLTNGIALWKGARVFRRRESWVGEKLNIFRKVGKEPIRIMDLKAMPQAATSQTDHLLDR
ncbi:hypothetical protein PO124_24065 [Bacillus licheniformis]|nr:hypothetical protein [Bacillus licheniformis]